MPFTLQPQSATGSMERIVRGRPLDVGDLTGAVLSETMDVSKLSRISLGFTYRRGGGSTVTAINTTLQASFDEGATFAPVVINQDPSTPPDVGTDPGTFDRTVSAADVWAQELDVSTFPLIRLSIAVTGAAAAGDEIDVDAYGERG